MNYEKNYRDYVKWVRAQKREKYHGVYYEEHHVKPRSLGGKDTKANLVLLTPREHFLAHYLLCKIYGEGEDHYRMVCAFNLFLTRDESEIARHNSREFERKKAVWIKFLREASRAETKKGQGISATKAKARRKK